MCGALPPSPLRRLGGAMHRMVAPFFANSKRSKWLPLDSRSFGPPRRRSHTPEYCRARGFERREVFAAGTLARRVRAASTIRLPRVRLCAKLACETAHHDVRRKVIPGCGEKCCSEHQLRRPPRSAGSTMARILAMTLFLSYSRSTLARASCANCWLKA